MEKETKMQTIKRIVNLLAYVLSACFICLTICLGVTRCTKEKETNNKIDIQTKTQERYEIDSEDISYLTYQDLKNNLYGVQILFDIDYSLDLFKEILAPMGIRTLSLSLPSGSQEFLINRVPTGKNGLSVIYHATNEIDITYNPNSGVLACYLSDDGNWASNVFEFYSVSGVLYDNRKDFDYYFNNPLGEQVTINLKDSSAEIISSYALFSGADFIQVGSSTLLLKNFNVNYMFSRIFKCQPYSYSFDNSWNPLYYFSMAVTNLNTLTDMGSHQLDYRLPMCFYSNGELFDEIHIRASYTFGIWINGDTENYDDMTNLVFAFMEYKKAGTSKYQTACATRVAKSQYRSIAGQSTLVKYYATMEPYVWSSDSYQNIIILGNGNYVPYAGDPAVWVDPILNLSNFQILKIRGSVITKVSKGDNGILGGSFTLLTTAFTSISSFLSIQLFPGITLGVLLFLPLVAGIIIAIIWIVKR